MQKRTFWYVRLHVPCVTHRRVISHVCMACCCCAAVAASVSTAWAGSRCDLPVLPRLVEVKFTPVHHVNRKVVWVLTITLVHTILGGTPRPMDKGLHELYLSDKEWRRMAILQDQFKRRRKKKVRGTGGDATCTFTMSNTRCCVFCYVQGLTGMNVYKFENKKIRKVLRAGRGAPNKARYGCRHHQHTATQMGVGLTTISPL